MNMRDNDKTPVYTEPFVRRHRPFFVTLFVLIPVLMIPALLLLTMFKSDIFQQWRTLHAVYPNTQGLKKGNQVSMSGITIGHVRSVNLLREGEVHVNFDVSNRYKHLVRKDTRARLKQRGFVGDWEIELIGGSAEYGESVDNDTLYAERMVSIDDVVERAGGIIDTGIALLMDVAAIIQRLDAGEGVLGQLLVNDTLFRHLNEISVRVLGLTSSASGLITETRGAIREAHGVVRDLQTTAAIADTMFVTLTNMGTGGIEFVDSLMGIANRLNSSVSEVDAILGNLKTVSGDAPELLDMLRRDLYDVEQMLRILQESRLFRMLGGNGQKNPNLTDTP